MAAVLYIIPATFALSLVLVLLAVRARNVSFLLMAPLVFEAPPQEEGPVRSVPATLGVRSFQRFPAYVPLTFDRFLRAERSQKEGMSEYRWARQFGGASGSGDGASG